MSTTMLSPMRNNPDTYKKLLVLCLVIIIALGGTWYYQSQKPVETAVFDAQPYRDSIQTREDLLQQKKNEIDSILKINTALHLNSQGVILRYNDKFRFIKGASATELDSILKINW